MGIYDTNIDTVFQGKLVPKLTDKNGELNCSNSYCFGIHCAECINFPMGESVNIKDDFLKELNKDEHISEGLEGLLDDRDSGGC